MAKNTKLRPICHDPAECFPEIPLWLLLWFVFSIDMRNHLLPVNDFVFDVGLPERASCPVRICLPQCRAVTARLGETRRGVVACW